MYIEEVKETEEGEEEFSGGADVLCKADGLILVWWDAKRVLVGAGAGAGALFYPTLLYNIARNKIQAEFHWWDWIDKVIMSMLRFLNTPVSYSVVHLHMDLYLYFVHLGSLVVGVDRLVA